MVAKVSKMQTIFKTQLPSKWKVRPQDYKIQNCLINKTTCCPYEKINTSSFFFFWQMNIIILTERHWPWAQKKARSKWQPICGAAVSCLFCNCLCPRDAWPCLSEHELAAEFSLAASYLHMLAGKLSRLLQAGGLACICTAFVAQWQTLGVIVGVTHQNPQRHGRNPWVFSHKGKGAHLP